MLRLREEGIFTAGKSIASPLAGIHLGAHCENDGVNLQRQLAVIKVDVVPTDGITLTVGEKVYTFRDTITTDDEIRIGNLVTNGDFAADDVGWINYGNWVISGGVALHTDGTPIPSNPFTQALVQEWFPKPIVGYSYVTVFTVTNRSAGSVRVKIGGVLGTVRSTNATFTETIVATSDDALQFIPTADFDGEVSAVAVTNTHTDIKGLTASAIGDRINLDKAHTHCTAYGLGLINLIALVVEVPDLAPQLICDGAKILKDIDWALTVDESVLEDTDYFKKDITTEGDVKPTVLVERNSGTDKNFLY